ncbi:MAG TPA: hypothetical protein VLI39_06910 [Sedimentisphaerales bacterium]|nr:hypothetical protein [Sedimentisphaerales bacterium]
MLLPLPLVPFESLMLADDRPAYPMNCFARIRFHGRLDRTALESAMAVAVSRHPLLAAVVRRSGSQEFWVAANQPPALQWRHTPLAESLPPLAPLDVRVEPGLRVVSCEDAGNTDLIIQVHHACCDGLGVLRFTEDLFLSCALASKGVWKPVLRALCPERLLDRGRFDQTADRLLQTTSRQAIGLLGAGQFRKRIPEPLVPHQARPDDSSPPPDYPASLTRRLDGAESTELVMAVRRLGVTVNDLLVRDCFLTLKQWRMRTGDPSGWVRVAVPVNLRTRADRRLPAANRASVVFLDRMARHMDDSERLLDSVHQEMALIKQRQLGATFVLTLENSRSMSDGLQEFVHPDHCTATVILTNLGAVLDRYPVPQKEGRFVIGGAVLQSMEALAPLRPLTCAAFAVVGYAGELHVTLHYDSRVLTVTDARELIEDFTGRVRESADAREHHGIR